MSQVLYYLYIAAGVVFLFGAAIFVHEFGHFWVALKRGLKVEDLPSGSVQKLFPGNAMASITPCAGFQPAVSCVCHK